MNNKALTFLAVVALSAGLADCSGGGGSSPTPIALTSSSPTIAPSGSPTTAPTTSPSGIPTTAPTATPAATPTVAPTIAPTPVPLALKVIGGAPLSATAAQLSVAKRNAQAKTLAQGVENGLPILVESSGMIAAWAGDQAVWVTNAQNPTQDIPETSGTITPSGNLPITNPGFTPLSCLGQVSAVCAVHPTGWTFGTSSTNGKSVGKQTLTVAFSDGATAASHSYVYNGWNLPCNSGWAYVGGVPVAQATRATSDVYADCVAAQIVFPKGAVVLTQPIQDQYGRAETVMPNLTAQPIFAAANGFVSMSSVPYGIVFGIITQDGGFAKVFFQGASSITTNASSGMALHSNASGGFDF